jgi:hypothetical protein
MVWGIAGIVARGIVTAARGGGGATKQAVQTLPAKTGWGAYAKTGIVGGSVAAGGFGISSAVGSAQQSIEQGGAGLLTVGGIIVAIILFLFIILRRK